MGCVPVGADNIPRPPVSRLCDPHQPVITTRIGVLSLMSAPVCRMARTPVVPCITPILPANLLHHMRLWPRRDAIAQDFLQRPHMVGQASRHGWCTRLPHPG
jgi:hypothetical protein